MKEADKLTILKMAVDAEQGKEVELDFSKVQPRRPGHTP
jgi:hypothetical protein